MNHPQMERYDLQRLYGIERAILAPYASLSQTAEKTRRYPEPSHAYRTPFQRDRDRIIHSRAFRRLKHKRQVFFTNIGDHYRTRLTHTMEVVQIARTIARAMGLNEDLTEAIALGHDLGHTPFGHLGEEVLHEILTGAHGRLAGFPEHDLGGFKHNYQSLRILDLLESKYEFPGLNLTAQVREGILKHTNLRKGHIQYPNVHRRGLHLTRQCASTLEGQVVAMADEVAQRTHDLEDGIRAGLVAVDDVRELELVRIVEEKLALQKASHSNTYLYHNRLINGLIDLLVTDLIEASLGEIESRTGAASSRQFRTKVVRFSSQMNPLQLQLNKFIYARIIHVPSVELADDTLRQVLLGLYVAYAARPDLLPEVQACHPRAARPGAGDPRNICDHIAGMTDNFALTEFKKLQAQSAFRDELEIHALDFGWMQ